MPRFSAIPRPGSSARTARMVIGLLAVIVVASTVAVSERARNAADTQRKAQAELRHAQALSEQLRAAQAEGLLAGEGPGPKDAARSTTEAMSASSELRRSIDDLDRLGVNQKVVDRLRGYLGRLVQTGLKAVRIALTGDRRAALKLQQAEVAPTLALINNLTRTQAREQDRLAERSAVLGRQLFVGSLLAGLFLIGLLAWRFEHLVRKTRVTAATLRVRRESEEELRHQAYHDALTGLANRTLFEQRLKAELMESATTGVTLAVAFIDLDDFKMINDGLGHHAGDELLRVVADRIAREVGEGNLIARLGGDEFAVLLHCREQGARTPQLITERILHSLNSPLIIGERELRVSGSAGIALSEAGCLTSADEMLRNADVAMYSSKSSGKDRVAIFDPTMHADAMRRLELTADLRRALEDGGLLLEYQPIVNVGDAQVVGTEALARWPHPVHGRIPPPEFIELAEDSGLIIALGQWVLQTACTQMQEWMNRGLANASQHVSVNVSALQLSDSGMHDMVKQTLLRTGLDPRQLQLEITESVLVENPEVIAQELTPLMALGVRLAIDDFGTGHSALAYLRQLPFDVLKVDKGFIDDIEADDGQARLTHGIINLAHALDITVVAEGIETRGQAVLLRAMGPILGQGYLYSRPVSANGAGTLMRDGVLGSSHRIAQSATPRS